MCPDSLPLLQWEASCKNNGISPEDPRLWEWLSSIHPEGSYPPLPPWVPDPAMVCQDSDRRVQFTLLSAASDIQVLTSLGGVLPRGNIRLSCEALSSRMMRPSSLLWSCVLRPSFSKSTFFRVGWRFLVAMKPFVRWPRLFWPAFQALRGSCFLVETSPSS